MVNSLMPFSSLRDIARFDPFREMDDFFQDYASFPRLRMGDAAQRIRVDMSENEQAYMLRAELPGVQKEDIKVAIDGNQVSITAEVKKEEQHENGNMVRSERYYGQQYRSFSLPQEVDESKAEAKCHDGILELTLPKKPGGGGRTLQIQ